MEGNLIEREKDEGRRGRELVSYIFILKKIILTIDHCLCDDHYWSLLCTHATELR